MDEEHVGCIGVVGVVLAIVLTVVIIMSWYGVNKDVDALIDRAQVAADRDDMLDYMVELEGNLKRRGMDRGHTAVIFKTPANDLALHYKTVTRVIERLESIKDIPKTETTYQVALDDIRGTIRELPNPSGSYTWARLWFLYHLASIFGVIGIVCCAIAVET